MLSDPIAQFEKWFEEIRSHTDVQLSEAMCLSTVSPEGFPEGRMVLLKEFSEKGFVFYTNLDSPKAESLTAHPQASLTFYWERLRRQVRIFGRVEKVSDHEADEYFHSRPRLSQIGAWASHQSSVLPDRETLERQFAECEKKFEGADVPRPDFWSGYRVVPQVIEFWQEKPNRLHDRFWFELKNGSWKVSRLSP